jgi:hypothetical protein
MYESETKSGLLVEQQLDLRIRAYWQGSHKGNIFTEFN